MKCMIIYLEEYFNIVDFFDFLWNNQTHADFHVISLISLEQILRFIDQ